MNIGEHIPLFMLCKQFSKRARTLVVHPPDLKGLATISDEARFLAVITNFKGNYEPPDFSYASLFANPEDLPFKNDSIDLILYFADSDNARPIRLERFLRSANRMLSSSGILALSVPNPNFSGNQLEKKNISCGFFDLKRIVKRQFIHSTVLVQYPVYGAMISKVETDNDRLFKFSEDGTKNVSSDENPSRFIIICSRRHHRATSELNLRFPFNWLKKPMSERILQLEKEFKLAVDEKESSNFVFSENEQRIDVLEKKLIEVSSLQRKYARLERSEKNANNKNVILEEMLKDANIDLDSLSARLMETESRLQKHNLNLRTFEMEKKKNTHMLQLYTIECDKLKRDCDSLYEEQEKLKTEKGKIATELEKQRERNTQLEDKISKLTTENNTLKEELENEISSNLNQKTEYSSMKTNCAALEEELKKVKKIKLDVEDKFSSYENMPDDKTGDESQIIKKLKKELLESSSELENRDEEIWELREKAVRLEAQIAASVSAIGQDTHDEQLHEIMAKKDHEITALKKENAKLKYKKVTKIDLKKKAK